MDNTRDTIQQTVERVADASAVTVGVATFLDMLPQIAAAFTIIWLGIRIWESLTGEGFDKSFLARAIIWPIDWVKAKLKNAR